MFERLAQHRKILVTGPHRSGTTICARMIAQDTGHDLVIEDEFGFSKPRQLYAFLRAEYGPQVLQAPFICHEIHDLEYLYGIDLDDCLIVMMRRELADIIESEQRAPVNFVHVGNGQRRLYNAVDQRHQAEIKYEVWELQRERIPHWLEVEYESLAEHPLWRADHKALPFQHAVRQTRVVIHGV